MKSVINILLRRIKVNKAFYAGKRKNYVLKEVSLRNIFLALIPTILLLIMTALAFCLPFEKASNDLEFEYKFLVNDTLAIYIEPPVESISVDCDSLKSNSFRVAFFSNETQYGKSLSLVYMMPRYEGEYVLLVSFSSSRGWNGTIGVYTSDSDFYKGVGSVTYTSQGYFVRLHTIRVSPKDNVTSDYKIKVVLQVYNISSSLISIFNFPTPINMGLFIATGIAVVYFDAFFFMDLYFKNKREGVTRTRWALAGLLILVSFFILYQIYIWMSGG